MALANDEEINRNSSNDREIPFSYLMNCPTSCWTLNDNESYLMWKSYASEFGARIKTSVYNLIASIKLDLASDSQNKILCGSMDYKGGFYKFIFSSLKRREPLQLRPQTCQF